MQKQKNEQAQPTNFTKPQSMKLAGENRNEQCNDTVDQSPVPPKSPPTSHQTWLMPCLLPAACCQQTMLHVHNLAIDNRREPTPTHILCIATAHSKPLPHHSIIHQEQLAV